MIEYDKIVRDRIPEIIEKSGAKYDIEILTDEKALLYLEKKLQEELDEYYKNKNVDELADIMEVIEAIAERKGYAFGRLLSLKEEKRKARGGFEKNILLKRTY
jgi:predicted house-cleaning noncanonical NTP pyrophosphatase (MazG superfamily)